MKVRSYRWIDHLCLLSYFTAVEQREERVGEKERESEAKKVFVTLI